MERQFTRQAENALKLAKMTAKSCGHGYIGTEHQPVEAFGLFHIGGGDQHAHIALPLANTVDQIPELYPASIRSYCACATETPAFACIRAISYGL